MTDPRHPRGSRSEVLRRAVLAFAGAATGLVAAAALGAALDTAGDDFDGRAGHGPALSRVGTESMIDIAVAAARWIVVLCAVYVCVVCLLNLLATRSTPRIARFARAVTPRMVAAMAAGLLVATAASPSGASPKGASPSDTGGSATEMPDDSTVWMYRIGSGDGRGDGTTDSTDPGTGDPDATTANTGSPDSAVPTTSDPVAAEPATSLAGPDTAGADADNGTDHGDSTTTRSAQADGARTARTWLPWAELPWAQLTPATGAPPAGPDTDTSTPPNQQTPPESPESSSSDDAAAAGTSDAAHSERFYTVEPGDHFWSIAERTVAQRSGVDPSALTEREVARYWLDLIEVNRHRLVDPDNPDLIHPGLEIELPG